MTSQFNLENDINSLLRMDAPLNRVPLPRWQRKVLNSSNLSNNSFNVSSNNSLCKTPKASGNGASENFPSANFRKTPSKTPKKTPGKSKGSPKKAKTPKTPNGGDRFIPNRTNTNFEIAHYKVTQEPNNSDNDQNVSPNQDLKRAISTSMHGRDISSMRIISYATKAPPAPEGFHSELRVLYSSGKQSCSSKPNRYIPQVPERILDAPEILDDYYLNILDWSATNVLAVALSDIVYLWNASNGEIQLLLKLESNESYVSSVSWMEDGSYLAVGTSTGEVQLWDVNQNKRVRVMGGHIARVGALSWNQFIVSSGSRSGLIHHHDVRTADHLVGTLSGHSQEVCGLKWSPDGRYLASGGNDNLLNIWPCAPGECFTQSSVLHSFDDHTAAVKAIAWCPWQPQILATGGGTTDQCIRIWNCNSGVCLNTTDTKSQVCSVLWSKEYRELISGHGYAHNQLAIWKYPSMSKLTELHGHTARVLNMCMSPDGTTVVSAAADETLRLWNCFVVDVKMKRAKKATDGSDNVILRQNRIR